MTRIAPKRTVAVLLTAAALAAPAAGAVPAEQVHGSAANQPAPATARFVPDGPDSGLYCGKDYSRNPMGGDYCVRIKATASPPPQSAVKRGFSWGDAGAGGAATLALILAAAGCTAVVRRRRAASRARGHGSPATMKASEWRRARRIGDEQETAMGHAVPGQTPRSFPQSSDEPRRGRGHGLQRDVAPGTRLVPVALGTPVGADSRPEAADWAGAGYELDAWMWRHSPRDMFGGY
jgi:hypothetical protein